MEGKRDELKTFAEFGENALMIGGLESIIFIEDNPRIVEGAVIASPYRVLKGAPGVTGPQAMAVYASGGETRGVWVSYHGIYETDGFRTRRISDDLDWSATVSVANLSSAVLSWDPDRQVIEFDYPSGSSGNDRYLLFHMSPEHRNARGLPKVTGPHYRKAASVAGGLVSGTYRRWSGHWSDGKVYLEDDSSATTDASQAAAGVTDPASATAFTTTQVPLSIQTGRQYNKWRITSIHRGNLRHTSAGSGQNLSLRIDTGRDPDDRTNTVTKTVSLNGHKGTEFYVARSGEWNELILVHTGAASFALQDVRLDVSAQGRTGKVLA